MGALLLTYVLLRRAHPVLAYTLLALAVLRGAAHRRCSRGRRCRPDGVEEEREL